MQSEEKDQADSVKEGGGWIATYLFIAASFATVLLLSAAITYFTRRPSNNGWDGLDKIMIIADGLKFSLVAVILISPLLVAYLTIATRNTAVATAVYTAILMSYVFFACSYSPWVPMRQTSLIYKEAANDRFWMSEWISVSIWGMAAVLVLLRRTYTRLAIASAVGTLGLVVVFRFFVAK